MKKIFILFSLLAFVACTAINPSVEKVRDLDLKNSANNTNKIK